MRRAAAFAGLVLAVLVAPAAPLSADVAGAGMAQFAIADWTFIRGDHGTWYLAIADRGLRTATDAEDAGPAAFVLLAKGRCDVERGRNVTVIICGGRGIFKEIPFDRFEVDPLLESATVTVRGGGFRNRVAWTGVGNTPPPEGEVRFGPGYADAFAGMGRPARATGRIFGDRVRRGGGFSFAGLGQGAWAGGDAFSLFDEIEPTGPGTFRFTRTIRLRS